MRHKENNIANWCDQMVNDFHWDLGKKSNSKDKGKINFTIFYI